MQGWVRKPSTYCGQPGGLGARQLMPVSPAGPAWRAAPCSHPLRRRIRSQPEHQERGGEGGRGAPTLSALGRARSG